MNLKATSALIGLDLGTTVCKSIVFDEQLRILAYGWIAPKDCPFEP